MASGSQNMTTYNARIVTGSNNAASPDGALLLSGTGRVDDATGDTWIFLNSLRGTTNPWGIKHDQANNKLQIFGSGTNSFSVRMDTGDTYILGKVGIGYDPETSGNTYKLYVDGSSYFTDHMYIERNDSAHIYLINKNWTKGTNPSSQTYSAIEYRSNDSSDSRVALLEATLDTSGNSRFNIYLVPNVVSSTSWSGIVLQKTNADVLTVNIAGATTVSGTVHANGGYLKSTANGNTVQIGSQNSSCCHIYNSQDIPFAFSHGIFCVNQGDLGTTTYPFHQLVLGGATNATMTAASTNPRITFQENTGTQPVHILYCDWDSYRSPAGLKIIGGTSASPAWFEVEGQIYGARFNGPVTGNVTGNCSGSSGSCTGNAATATKVGEAASWLYFHHSNEVNFGGTNTSTTIFYGYRATDSRGKPTIHVFGSGEGTATVKAAKFQTGGNTAAIYQADRCNVTASNGTIGIHSATNRGLYEFTDGKWIIYLQHSDDTVRSGYKIYGAVWNDFAEMREGDITEGGYAVYDDGHGHMKLCTERLQPGARLTSDTFGIVVGHTEKAKTPIGVAGRVLVYPVQDRMNYKVGDAVCAAPGGKVDIMTREEIMMYPERILGTVSEIPDYEIWNQRYKAEEEKEYTETNVEVKGRIWIYVR